jgi:hypothetical protein
MKQIKEVIICEETNYRYIEFLPPIYSGIIIYSDNTNEFSKFSSSEILRFGPDIIGVDIYNKFKKKSECEINTVNELNKFKN